MSDFSRFELLPVIWKVWGRAFLFHHNTATVDDACRWECALVEALACMEEEGSSLVPVQFFQEKLIAPLNDPLSFARSPDISPSGIPSCQSIVSGEGWTYLPIRSPDDGVQKVRELVRRCVQELVVLDFRFIEPGSSPQHWDELFRAVCTGHAFGETPEHRGHSGWAEPGSDGPYRAHNVPSPVYRRLTTSYSTREVSQGASGESVAAASIVALVDNRVCLLLAEHLAVLRACGRGRVIWECSGAMEIQGDGLELRTPFLEAFIRAPASHWLPDHTVARLPSGKELKDLARSIVSEKCSIPVNRIGSIERCQHAPELWRRAQRLAGWIKTCTVWEALHPLAPTGSAFWEKLLHKGQEVANADLNDAEHYEALMKECQDIPDGHLLLVPPQSTVSTGSLEDVQPGLHRPEENGKHAPIRKLGAIGWLSPFSLRNGREVQKALLELKNCSGLILDLRGYPNNSDIRGSLVEGLCPAPFESGIYEIPLALNPEGPTREFNPLRFHVSSSNREPYSGTVVALIDETVVSAAEDVCLYLLEADRVTFVGHRTAGCLGNVTHIHLPDGARTDFSGMRVLDSRGNLLSGSGISPNVYVPRVAEPGDADPVAEAGLEVLESLISRPDTPHRSLSVYVQSAKDELQSSSGHRWSRLEPAARSDLQRHLESRLTRIASSTVEARASARTAARLPSIFAPTQSKSGNDEQAPETSPPSIILDELLSEYPVLEDLLEKECGRWVSANLELLDRWSADRLEVEESLFNGQETGPVTGVVPGLSDPHNGGRTATILEFGSAAKLVYKPKSLELDHAFAQLLNWCNEKGLSHELRSPRMVVKAGYGWMEYLNPALTLDDRQQQEYLRRAGMLLCLVHLLESSDLHVENVVGVGPHPMLIDLECLLQHRLKDPDPIFLLRPRRFCGSVLRTRLLPAWTPDSRGGWWFDPGVVGPLLSPDRDISREGVEEVVFGFEEVANLVHRHRQELTDKSGPLSLFSGTHARVIFQDTLFYIHLIERSTNPRYLRRKSLRMDMLDLVSRPLTLSSRQERHRPRFETEKEMLESLDVPHFSAPTTGTTLLAGGEPVLEECFAESSLARALLNIRELEPGSLKPEEELIRRALTYERPEGIPVQSPNECESQHQASTKSHTPLANEEFLLEAEAIGERLYSTAIRSSEGVMWPTESVLNTVHGNVLGIQPCDAFLYSGACGIGIFMAALANETGNSKFRALAVQATAPLLRLFEDRKALEHVIRTFGLGIGEGLGSLMYGLVRTGTLLGELEFIETASRGSEAISRSCEIDVHSIDLLGGVAGTIQALLALEDASNSGKSLGIALELGQKTFLGLSTTFSISDDSESGSPGTGFAHGLAGIGYTLLRLGKAANSHEFITLGQSAIATENLDYDPATKNWRVAGSTEDDPVYRWSYCHGAPGIGLGRLASLLFLDSPKIRSDIGLAVESTLQVPNAPIDHLCCGNGGRIETILTAAEMLQDQSLHFEAINIVSAMIHAKRARGYFRFIEGRTSDQLVPGFFRGLAGIGYLMLRLRNPSSLPNIILFQ